MSAIRWVVVGCLVLTAGQAPAQPSGSFVPVTDGLAERIRAELGVPIVIGGTHASYYPESCLEFSDYVVFGEGDETILDLVDALVRGRDVADVPGIAYRRGDRVLRTAARPGPERFDTVPDYRAGAVQSRHHRGRRPAARRHSAATIMILSISALSVDSSFSPAG